MNTLRLAGGVVLSQSVASAQIIRQQITSVCAETPTTNLPSSLPFKETVKPESSKQTEKEHL